MDDLICRDCSKQLQSQDATTYLVLHHYGFIQDYARVLCKDCLIKRKKALGKEIKGER